MRAGARFLAIATSKINRGILRELSDRPLQWGSDREAKITPVGREMLFVSFVAERWLQDAPGGPIPFDSDEAERVVGILIEGWCSTLIHTLAERPLTLRELDHSIDDLSRRALKRRLLAMQGVGQLEARPGDDDETAYAVTDWLRTAIAPLAAAARLERREPTEDMAPIDDLDVQAAFLLTLPLLELPDELSGTCRLAVEIEGDESTYSAGATVRVEAGQVVWCIADLVDDVDAWATASAGDWLDTVIEPDAKRVRTGGNRLLASILLNGLHSTLFGIPVR